MNLLKLFPVCLLLLTLVQCGQGGRGTNTNVTTLSSATSANPSPDNSFVPTSYQALVRPSPNPTVRELPFRLPNVEDPHEVFEESEIRFIANNRPPGGQPDPLGDEAREELRKFIGPSGIEIIRGSRRSDTLFYNGLNDFSQNESHDILTDEERQKRANRETAARNWVINKVELRKSVSESVKHRWNATPEMPGLSLPQTLVGFVQTEFESLKNNLTQEQRARLANCQISVGAPPNPSPGESLWLKQNSNVLWISPFLVRGLLLQSVQGPAEREYDRALENNSFPTTFLNNRDVLNEVTTNFKAAIRYLLAHNMAHLIFTPTPGTDTEVEVDRIAFGLLSSRDVGPFFDFLDHAVQVNEAGSGWGVEASGDGSRVRDRIRSSQ